MRSRLRRMFTFANVCSALALFVALSTGTAYAADTIFSTDIVDGQVMTQDLHAGAVTSAKIKDGTIVSDDIADTTITGQKLANETVGSSQIATDAIGPTEIADNSIDTGEIVDDSLFAADLAPNSVGSSEIAAGAVGASEVANNSLTMADIKGADVSGHVSFSAGAVANGACKDFNISVGGASVGEAVVISTQAALPEGLIFYGVQVPSTNNVTMKICNFTGGTMAAISNFPIRVITYG